MRKLVVSTFVSLDGVMQAPGGPDEDRSGNFDLGGWSVNYWDDQIGAFMDELMGRPFDLLLGRRTYDIFASYWPSATDDIAKPLNAATKYVVSTTLSDPAWGPSVVIADDFVDRIQAIKKEEGPELQVHGSSQLLQLLIANDLVDEYNLRIFPLILGHGKRLFGEMLPSTGLETVSAETSSKGVTLAIYRPAGPIVPGSFE